MLITANELRSLYKMSIEDEEKINKQLVNLIRPNNAGILCAMSTFKAPDILINNLIIAGYNIQVCYESKSFLVKF